MSRAQADLSFLDASLVDHCVGSVDAYTRPHWLVSAYADSVWHCEFGHGFSVALCWDVPVGDSGDRLMDPRFSGLLEVLKMWVATTKHPHFNAGRMVSSTSEYHSFNYVVDWIDYFLLRFGRLGLNGCGLSLLSSNDILASIAEIASGSRKAETVYEWKDRVTSYLLKAASELASGATSRDLAALPVFLWQDLPPKEDRLSELPDITLIKARISLWLAGDYRRNCIDGFRWSVSSAALCRHVLTGSIRTRSHFSPVLELCVDPMEPVLREKEAVPVRDDRDDAISDLRLSGYMQALRGLVSLQALGLEIPVCLSEILARPLPLGVGKSKSGGRYRSLPPTVVLDALKDAIEFWLRYAASLMSAYVVLFERAHAQGTSIAVAATRIDFVTLIDDVRLSAMVRTWALTGHLSGRSRRPKSAVYFSSFRSNEGLWELLRVLFGCGEFIVGVLSARRVQELVELDAQACLDVGSGNLLFDNRKSGVMGCRQTIGRPIPQIAVRVIQEIASFQNSLRDVVAESSKWRLFSHPSLKGEQALVECSQGSFRANLDFFSDYFELPGNGPGTRYYVRQHQLRRFFAMVFFWTGSFGGLDTLRYFLGHADLEHVYRYITESTPGAMLNGIKAEWASSAVLASQKSAEGLGRFVQEVFGINDFKVLQEDELADYIEVLISDRRVTIEPEFLDKGRSFRVIVIVRELV